MTEKPLLYVANWKMQLPYTKAVEFARDNKHNFINLAKQSNAALVLCPSFDALSSIATLFNDNTILIGAQNCAPYPVGAYTGEVSVQSLQEIGCRYCIVGHSERRTYFHETDELIAQKIKLLQAHNIAPIVCIGETKEQHAKKEIHAVLRAQLEAVEPFEHIIIAYEPVWAIGTGIPATTSYIQEIFDWIAQECEKHIGAHYTLLYGGSVNGENAKELKAISGLGGFLIGNASLDFQKFQNIVLS